MKLRSLLLTAALFVTAGFAFAGQSYDESIYDISDYTWTNSTKGHTIPVTLEKGNQDGFKYAVYDVKAYSQISSMKWKDAVAKYEGKSLWLIESGTNWVRLPEGVTELGIVAITKDVYSSDNASDQWLFYRRKDSAEFVNSVSFGKPTDDQGQGNNKSAKITFGTPLPTPVVTLLIALALGAGFVMYRGRKQVKA